ncbi:MAG: GatB/YqeY domain-containing protein [Rhodospirillales bacterium]|nr:GatB/YqeY domain-containing protein [Rhodospirillales bacterium]
MLRTLLKGSLTTAMKARDEISVATLRLIIAALKDRDIAARSKGNLDQISDDAILDLLQSMIRQRQESIDMYRTAGRHELAEREAKEIEIIRTFLPEQLSEDEIGAAVHEVIDELGATGLKDMGRTMGTLKERFAGRMDFSKASAVVKTQLD